MKFHLKKLGELTHAEAEGTPEEVAEFCRFLGVVFKGSELVLGNPVDRLPGFAQDRRDMALSNLRSSIS